MQEGRIGSEPRLSVGMPVYNGADYVAEAIESILNQTHQDLELVICDNASTDPTAEICRAYAEQDSRIRYFRNRRNIGAGPNNNRVFELSTGSLFKIANHDDVCHPEFIEKCVAVLDNQPEVVCAFPSTVDIDTKGVRIRELPRRPDFGANDPITRIWGALHFEQEPMAIFGVMRAEIVEKTGLMTPVPSADRIWLAELLMHGPFIEVEEPLFLHREHEARSVHAAGRGHASMAWWDPSEMKTFAFPYWRMLRNLRRAVKRSPLNTRDRIRVHGLVFKWATVNKHYLKLIYDVAIPARGIIDRFYKS